MQRNFLIIIIFCLCSFIIISCESSSTKASDKGYMYGKVKNAENEIIEGARIVFNYGLEEVSRPTSEVRFDLAKVSNVKIWISKFAQTDTIRVLLDGVMSAGSHAIVWDGKNDLGQYVYNYAYDIHFETDDVNRVSTVIYSIDYSDVTGNIVEDYEAYSITDSSGEFTIPLENLLVFDDLDDIQQIDEAGNQTGNLLQISHYIKVWALHPDYEATFVDSIYVREDKNVNVNINFED